jgi:hypothetical protein
MQARMSDLVGELDNEQKREIEQLRLKVGMFFPVEYMAH